METVTRFLLLTVCVCLAYGFCTKESEFHGSNEPLKAQASKHYDEDGEHNDDYDREAILGEQLGKQYSKRSSLKYLTQCLKPEYMS